MAQAEEQTSHRLTTADVELFERVATGMIRYEEWGKVTRNRDEQADYFEIQPFGETEVAYSVGRCATGSYILLNHRTGDVRLAGTLSALLENEDTFSELRREAWRPQPA